MRTRTVLNAQALNGVFRYECPTGICTVNVLDLAARNGQITAKDPTVTSVLGNIEAAMKTVGTRSAVLLMIGAGVNERTAWADSKKCIEVSVSDYGTAMSKAGHCRGS